MNQSRATILFSMVLASLVAPVPGECQTTTAPAQQVGVSTTGVVASTSPSTLVVKTAAGQFILFIYDEHIVKPTTIPTGSTVTVISSYTRTDGVPVANYITITAAAPAAAKTAPAAPGQPAAAAPQSEVDAVVPENVRELERNISKQAKRFHAGVQGGIGLDPEVILIGLNARMTASKNGDFVFRPSVDFGFGEVTKMFQINLDATYRLPLSPRHSNWAAYVGAGPNFSFVSQNYENAAIGDNGVDFSDFSFKAGLNIITGIEYRSGMFYELKAGVWTTPVIRLMIGKRF